MRELVTTLLDTAGLSAIAAGVAGGTWPYVGAWGLSFGGVVLLVGSALATRVHGGSK